MSKNKTYYVVTSGDYDEYRIIGITENKEYAESLQKVYEYENHIDGARIEEYINPEGKYIAFNMDDYYVTRIIEKLKTLTKKDHKIIKEKVMS